MIARHIPMIAMPRIGTLRYAQRAKPKTKNTAVCLFIIMDASREMPRAGIKPPATTKPLLTNSGIASSTAFITGVPK